MRSALAVLEKHVVQGVVALGPMVARCCSLVPMGAGLMAGLRCRPYFTWRDEMIRQLDGLRGYCERRMVARQPRRQPSQHTGTVGRPLRGRAACPAHRSQTAGSKSSQGSCISSKGGSNGPSTFAVDYIPRATGKLSAALPFARVAPQRRAPLRRLCEAASGHPQLLQGGAPCSELFSPPTCV